MKNYFNSLGVDKKTAILLIWLPLAIVFLFPLGFLPFFNFNYKEGALVQLITSILLLDSWHTVVTLSMLMTLPKFQIWAQEIYKEQRIRIYRRLTTIFSLVFVITYVASTFRNNSNGGYQAIIWIGIIMSIFSLHHSIMQSKGIGKLINRSAQIHPLAENEKNQLSLMELWAVRAQNLLFVLAAFRVLIIYFKEMHFNIIFDFDRILVMLSYIVVIYIYYLNFKFSPKLIKLKKWAFLSRFMLYIFSINMIWPIILLRGIHALEYLGVLMKMNIEFTGSTKRNYYYVLFTLIILFLITYPFREKGFILAYYSNNTVLINLLGLMGGLNLALNFTHYYIDRIMFRFRFAASRNLMN